MRDLLQTTTFNMIFGKNTNVVDMAKPMLKDAGFVKHRGIVVQHFSHFTQKEHLQGR